MLCTNRAGNAIEFIENGENGFIVDPMDVADIAEKAAQILEWTTEKKDKGKEICKRKMAFIGYEKSAAAFIEAVRYCGQNRSN